ncbi:MAG TPA: manganese catalase family protein [Bryobacteraceae bacterium]|nr:manganese catalase family protein [Bryobacteraceae bacterium]
MNGRLSRGKEFHLFTRINRLQIELQKPSKPDPDGASAVQELLGGRFGEMSTLNNYLHQSFGFKDKKKLAPFYELVASITSEEIGHVELVSATINMLLEGTAKQTDPTSGPMEDLKDARLLQQFIVGGPGHLVADSQAKPWNGDYVFNSGNLIADLLHNFFLETGARMHKHRVYQLTTNETGRTMIGYLMVRGGVHQAAYGRALEELTGVQMTKFLPLPNIDDMKIPEARRWMEKGEHTRLYTWGPDFQHLGGIWSGKAHWADNAALQVLDGIPQGGPMPDAEPTKTQFSPQYDPSEIYEIAARLMKKV